MSAAFVISISLFSAILVYVAQRVLYDQAVWTLPASFAGSTFNSPDSFIYRKGVALWAVLLIIAAIGIGLLAGRMSNMFAARGMLPFIAGLLILFQFGAFCLISRKTMTREEWPLHGRLLAPVFRSDLNNGIESVALKYDIPDLREHRLLWSLYFWLDQGTESKIRVNALSERSGEIPIAGKQYLLSSVDLGRAYALAYNVDGRRYYLYSCSTFRCPTAQ
jgi:hypothetical protein